MDMDPIGAAGKIISLIEAGIKVSDQLKDIAKSEHKLPSDLVNLYNNAQQLVDITEALPSTTTGSSRDPKVEQLADKAKNVSNQVVGIMDKINPGWRQRRGTPLTLWRLYLKQKEVQSIKWNFKGLRERMKLVLLDLVCHSNSEAKIQYEELRKRVSLGDEHVVSIQGLMHGLNQRLNTVQDSIYALGEQVGSASLAGDDFNRRAAELLILEKKLWVVLTRLAKDFQEKDAKSNAIAQSDPGTFDWVTQGSDYRQRYPDNLNEKEKQAYEGCDPDMLDHHAQASKNFRSFLQGSSRAFLILGKPGSGKSTFMKRLMHSPLVLQDLEQWAAKTNKTLIRAIFFFSVTQGSGALSSEESLYRSLLFQILRDCPALIDEILPGEADLPASISLPAEVVQCAIRRLFSTKSTVSEQYCFCLFIDGLDEFRTNFSEPKHGKAQNNYDVSELARRLVGWCQDEASNTKMIFSSRMIPALEDRFPAKSKIALHLHTKRDILQSALSNFKRQSEAIPEDYVELSKIICDQAQGVFLWARLVVKDILEAFTDGVEPGTFRHRIKKTPTDIIDLYAKILDRIKEQDREASAMILRLAAFQPVGFTLSTLACTWLDKFKDDSFPGNEPSRAYSDDESSQHRNRAIKRLAALTQGLLESQDSELKAFLDSTEIIPFFQSEIVFLHRTAQEFVRDLLMRSVEDAIHGILPWLQGSEDVNADDWPRGWRTNLYVRLFHAEMRFGIPRWDTHGKTREDLWDFGFWDESPEQLQLSHFKTLSDFSLFSLHYKGFYIKGESISYYHHQGIRTNSPHGIRPRRFTLQQALFRAQDVSATIQNRRLSRKSSSRIALTYTTLPFSLISMPLDGLEWLLQNKRICATDKYPVWYWEDNKEIVDWRVDNDCSCGDSNEVCFQSDHRPIQIWLIFLHTFAFYARSATDLSGVYSRKIFEAHCQVLELWLRYGAARDAVVLVTSKEKDVAYTIEAEDVFYVEVEQLLQLGESPHNLQSLQYLLARWRNSWASWIADWLSWAWTHYPRFQKNATVSAVPIRSRYRHMSTEELCQMKWKLYGVISDDDELVGRFYCRIA
ncbi:hypothetical protein V8C42DRAFT_318541 [Trichoderma barbatum]